MTDSCDNEEMDIVKIKQEIALSLRSSACPAVPGMDVWGFLREFSRSRGTIPRAVRSAIRSAVDERIAKLSYGEVVELWLQTDIGWESDESLADYIAEDAARREVVDELVGEMPGWASLEVYKEDNPHWRKDLFA